LERSCQLEGMLQSVLRKQEQLRKELEEVNGLVNGLREDISIEQEHPEEHPVISAPKREEEEDVHDENEVSRAFFLNPSTPPMMANVDSSSPAGLHLTQSTDSTEVILGCPHTPAQNPHNHILLHSPAHSCPMPNSRLVDALGQPYIDGEPAGLPRYRVNSDDEFHGLNWGFGCGTTLFGERLLEPDSDAAGIMTLSFDSLVDESATINSARATGSSSSSLAARTVTGAESHNNALVDNSLRSGSFDGINFRTGMSGHSGLNPHRKNARPMMRSQMRMMSEHRGIASVRGPLKKPNSSDEGG
jgi:hypothetical protein